ncbi:MAG: alcohol dehydrogenase [Bacteroidetes bacterium]|nr:MAG: alcohol dehydrogenase [Bacteroidota bacterium]
MKALILKEINQPVEFEDFENPSAGEDEVIVDLKAAALNHRDVWITKGMYPGVTTPLIMGSDGAGICEGKEVVINPSINWGDNPHFPNKNYHILGSPTQGTFAEYIKVNKQLIFPKPAHLDWETAAALPLGGLTAYRALFTKGQVKAGENVLISGVGGGVALFAFQFALAAGANVFVTSGSQEKIDRAMNMGAKGGVNYKDDNWIKDLKTMAGGFDVIIDSAAGEGFGQLAKTCNSGARMVIYGGSRGNIGKLSPQIVFWKQVSIHGTSMGNDQEFADMLDFVSQHQIIPVVDSVFALEDGQKALERMDAGKQFGKIVLKMGS